MAFATKETTTVWTPSAKELRLALYVADAAGPLLDAVIENRVKAEQVRELASCLDELIGGLRSDFHYRLEQMTWILEQIPEGEYCKEVQITHSDD